MFLNELKMWYAWLTYAAALNVAALATFYYKAPAQPILPNVAFAVEQQTWEDDDDCVIFVMCRRPADEVARDVHVKVTLSGDFPGGPKDESLAIRATEDKVKLPLRRDKLTKQVGKITARILDDTRNYAVGLREHTITISPPTNLVQFERSELSLKPNDTKGTFKVMRDSKAPFPLTVQLKFEDRDHRFKLEPEVVIPAGSDTAQVPFTVTPKADAKINYSILFTLAKTEKGPNIRFGERQQLTITQEADAVRPRIMAVNGTPAGSVRRGAEAEWTITAKLAAPVKELVELLVEIDKARTTAVAGVDFKDSFERKLRIEPGKSKGEIKIPLIANPDLKPNGVDLVLTLSAGDNFDLDKDLAAPALRIDNDTDGTLALFVLMTKQAKADWPALERELNLLAKDAAFPQLWGRRVIFVTPARQLLPWRIGTSAPPIVGAGDGLFFKEQRPINDYFRPALDAVELLGSQTRSKDFAAYIVYASGEDPNLSRTLTGGTESTNELKMPDRTIYVAWVSEPRHTEIQDRRVGPQHWLAQNFSKTGFGRGNGVRLFNREQLDGTNSFSAELVGMLRAASKK